MVSNRTDFMEKYPWAAGRTISVGVSDEHPFITAAYTSARKHHLLFRQRQFQIAFMERLEQSRQSILKKGIEMNDRHAISLRINAAISPHPFAVDKSKKRLSNRGVRRWIEGLDTKRIWEETESDDQTHDTAQNQSGRAVKI